MSIIKHVTLQKIVAHDFRYDPRIPKTCRNMGSGTNVVTVFFLTTLTIAKFIYRRLYERNATRYGLDDPGIESRWRRYFSAPVQTSPGAHPASSTMGTGSFP